MTRTGRCGDDIGDSPRPRERRSGTRSNGASRFRVIGRRLGRAHGSIRTFLVDNAGRRPRPPGSSDLRLTLAEREEISRGLAVGRSIRAIAAGMGRAPSTVCREVNANGGRATTGPFTLTGPPGSERGDPRSPSWPNVPRLRRVVEAGLRTTGRRSRSRRGWLSSIETTRRCG